MPTKEQVVAKILAKIQSKESLEAAEKLFNASPKELGEAAVKSALKEKFYKMVEKAGPLPSSVLATTGLEVRNEGAGSDDSSGQQRAESDPATLSPRDDLEPNFMGAGLFGRELCSTCNLKGAIGCFKIKDSRICLYCLPILKRTFKGDIDALHNLTLAEVKAFILAIKPEDVIVDR